MKQVTSLFKAPLAIAFQAATQHLENLGRDPVGATVSLADLRRNLQKHLTDQGLSADEVLRELVRDVYGGISGNAGGRFFAWAIGGAVPAALGADWLTSAWDQNAAIYACSPAAAIVEEVAGSWLKELLGIPFSASFAFVSGCQMAHATCLAAARHALLRDRGWDVERKGLCGAPPIRILASNAHGSIDRTIRFLGMGSENVIELPLDENAQATEDGLEHALRASPNVATIIVLQAGDLNSGSFDDYSTLIPLAKKYAAWVHVDGAFGLWAGASPKYRRLLKGIEAADSWATDGHKWLNVPYDSGYAFVADKEAHRGAMCHRASYLVHDEDARDQIDYTPEWSRRARGFSTYAAIRQLGRDGIAALVENCCEHARKLVDGISRLPGAEVVWEPRINQGLVRFRDSSMDATQTDHDRLTDAVIQRVNETGEAFFMGTTWRGRRAMRVSVLNWQTSSEDVERSIEAVQRALLTFDTLSKKPSSEEDDS